MRQAFREMAAIMIEQGEFELHGFSMSTQPGDPALGESSSTRFILHRRSDNEATAKK